MGKVTIIPSTINPLTQTQTPIGSVRKRKTAAYARVSTDSDEQYTSYQALVNYYSHYITERADWEFVKVYADEGITGTNTKKRDEFNRLIEDALSGKVDLIITKSISRFARNTLDAIGYTRKLKAAGVEVYFEKENLWSLDPKSEFILTICASIAQEESRSISQNVTIGKRWGMQAGKVSMAYKRFLGYEKKKDGSIGIVEDQAKIVRLIYRMFLVEGKTSSGIAKFLNENKIPTPSGKVGCRWTKTTIDSILTNEKYKGDALLQKTFMVDFLEHKAKKNEGEVPSYYVENSHPHIIEKDEWEMVQAEFARRAALRGSYSGGSPFTSKLICEDCRGFYGAKVWHSTDKYKKVILQCNRKFQKGQSRCQTPTLSETDIKALFLKAYNLAMVDKEQLIADSLEIKSLLTDTTAIDGDLERLASELQNLSTQVTTMVRENAKTVQDQEVYEKRYDALAKEYEKVKTAYNKVLEIRTYKKSQALKIDAFISAISTSDKILTEWSTDIWNVLVENGVVHRNGTITFKFKNGKEVTV